MSKIIDKIIFSQFDMPTFMEQNLGIRLIKVIEGKYKCKCPFPFHKDKQPSFSIDYKDGGWLWYCYGCGTGGSIINFVQKYYGMDYEEAIEKVCTVSGIKTDISSFLSAMGSSSDISGEQREFDELHIRLCIKCKNFLRDFPSVKENVKWVKEVYNKVNSILSKRSLEELKDLYEEVKSHTK